MRFDPQTLIRLAYRNDMRLTRHGGLIHILHPAGHLTEVWMETFKQHKPALLRALPDRERESQLDIFDDDY